MANKNKFELLGCRSKGDCNGQDRYESNLSTGRVVKRLNIQIYLFFPHIVVK